MAHVAIQTDSDLQNIQPVAPLLNRMHCVRVADDMPALLPLPHVTTKAPQLTCNKLIPLHDAGNSPCNLLLAMSMCCALDMLDQLAGKLPLSRLSSSSNSSRLVRLLQALGKLPRI